MSDKNAIINVNGDGYDANASIEQECRDKKHFQSDSATGKTTLVEMIREFAL